MSKYNWSSRLCAVAISVCLAACGGSDGEDNAGATPAPANPSAPAAPTAANTRLTLSSADIALGSSGSGELSAVVLGPDGQEVTGLPFVWRSSDTGVAVVEPIESVRTVVSRSLLAGADQTPVIATSTVIGARARVRAVGSGQARITATVTFADGSTLSQGTDVAVAPAPVSWALSLAPATVTLAANQSLPVQAVVRRSDGADGVAELSNWHWTSDLADFAVVPAADGRSATVSTGALGLDALTATLKACADTPAGDRLCAQTALARLAGPQPILQLSVDQVLVKPGRTSAELEWTLRDPDGTDITSSVNSLTMDVGSTPGVSMVANQTPRRIAFRASASALAPFATTLRITANVAGGRAYSASIPLVSTGAWHRLPDPPAGARPERVTMLRDGTIYWAISDLRPSANRLERIQGEIPLTSNAVGRTGSDDIILFSPSADNSAVFTVRRRADGYNTFSVAPASLQAVGTMSGLLDGCADGGTLTASSSSVVHAVAHVCLTSLSPNDFRLYVWGGSVTLRAAPPQYPALALMSYGTGATTGAAVIVNAVGNNHALYNNAPERSDNETVPDTLQAVQILPRETQTGRDIAESDIAAFGAGLVLWRKPLWQPWSQLTSIPFPGPVRQVAAVGSEMTAPVLVRLDDRLMVRAGAGEFIDFALPAMLAAGATTQEIAVARPNGKLRVVSRFSDKSVWVYDEP